jgi:hypothetical protein
MPSIQTNVLSITTGDDSVKEDVAHLELADKGNDFDNVVEKPDSIRGLSAEELQTLETRMVRKVDMVIM